MVTLPSADLKPGMEWNIWSITDHLCVNAESTYQSDNNAFVLAMERISAPAGTFDAQRIAWHIDFMPDPWPIGEPATCWQPTAGVVWLASGVGVVREEETWRGGNDTQTTTRELTSFTIH